MNFIHQISFSLDSTYNLYSFSIPQITIPDPQGTEDLVPLFRENYLKLSLNEALLTPSMSKCFHSKENISANQMLTSPRDVTMQTEDW